MTAEHFQSPDTEARVMAALTAALVVECGGTIGTGALCDAVTFDNPVQAQEFLRRWSGLVGLDPPDFAL